MVSEVDVIRVMYLHCSPEGPIATMVDLSEGSRRTASSSHG